MIAIDPMMETLPVNMGMISRALSRVVKTIWDDGDDDGDDDEGIVPFSLNRRLR